MIKGTTLEEMANFVFTSKYARYNEKAKRRETWSEAVERVQNMHLKKFKFLSDEDKNEIKEAFNAVKEKSIVPSMRSMQFGGAPQIAHEARGYNCSVRHIDSARAFSEVFYLSLCGCGIGIGLQKQFLNRLPALVSAEDKNGIVVPYVIDDTIEGWADSIEALLNCYFRNTAFTGRKIVFDYSRIRRKGSKIKTGGGKAPGYRPLKNALSKIKHLLDHLIEDKNIKRLRSIDVCDIICHCSDAVLAGGVRRSALSMIFDKDDDLMMNAKTGDWFKDNPQRARANNSVLLLRNEVSESDFYDVLKKSREFGEPGFVFSSESRQLLNPSLRKGTKVITNLGIKDIETLENTEFKVKNLYGVWENAICRLSGVNKTLYKIKLGHGVEYYSTAEHKWPIVSPRGFNKKETTDLVAGDKIAALRVFDLDYGREGSYEDGFICGWLYGDGWITDRKDNGVRQYGFIVSENDSKSGIHNLILNKLNSLIKRKVNWTERRRSKNSALCYELNVQADAIHKYFSQFRVDKKEMGLPSFIWDKASDNYIKGFIDGLFSADSSVHDGGIAFSTSRERIAKDLHLLLGFYGITSNIYYNRVSGNSITFPNGKTYDKDYDIWSLRIDRQHDVAHFKNVFRYTHLDKQSKLEKLKCNDEIYNLEKFVTVESVEKTNLQEDVWDLSVFDSTHCFQLSHCITGNCFEINFIPETKDEVCGVQMCNLTSINGAKTFDKETFLKQSKYASIIGTLQAAYTDFRYLSHASKEITEEEALLGVSITGMMDNPQVLLDPENQKEAALLAVETNETWAKKIGINPAARVCAIKPEGTSSIVLGASSGIHPHHSHKYFRRIQCNKLDNIYNFFKIYNPEACEESVWSANKTDDVVTFPVSIPSNAIVKGDLDAIKHLEIIRKTQENWVNYGTSKHNRKPIKHSVSCTVLVGDNEWDKVAKYLYENRDYFTAVSLLPKTGDKIYQQAPMEAVTTKEDEEKFNKLTEGFQTVDYSQLEELHDETKLQEEVACSGTNCELK